MSDASSALVQAGTYISYVVMTGAGLSATVCALKIYGAERFKLGQLELPLSHFVYFVLMLTIAHAFLTWVFIQRIGAVQALGKGAMTEAFGELTAKSGVLLFFNMQPRTLDIASWPHGYVFVAKSNDTAFWFTLVLAVGVIVAVLVTTGPLARPDSLRQVVSYVDRFMVGCLLAAVNWVIGSQWAIALSGLYSPG